MKALMAFIVISLLPQLAWPATPVLRLVQASQSGEALLRNGDFEQVRDGKLADWQAAPQRYTLGEGQGRNGSRALVCQNSKSTDYSGASQTLFLNRTNIAPLVVRGWSKAEAVSGSADNDYSLYVDIVYADGTPLWGQTGNFRCGSHDWQQREFVIIPAKPVKSLTLHCLFRHHTGKVWFDDVSLGEIKAGNGAVLFQGQPMQIVSSAAKSREAEKVYETRDGLKLALRGSSVSWLQCGGLELGKPGAASGFFVRDAGANSDVYNFEDFVCPELKLNLQVEVTAKPDHLVIQGRLSDVTEQDRAVTLLFALPIDATGWRWGDDIRRSRLIQGNGEFANTVNVHCGATGTESLYPLAAISNERTGLALALDMAMAAQYRLVYHAGAKQFFIAYDFGLVKETERFPGSADFRFVLYHFEPRWGFRAAFQKLTRIFPDYFVVRSKEQGIWMPFTDISTVQGWQDFGFKYHEGNNNVPFDDANGILSFRYTEPMTWWMAMKKDMPRSVTAALRQRDVLAKGSNAGARLAQASIPAAMFDEEGQPALTFRDTPWCNGAVWSLNPNPHLPGEINAATVHWSEQIKEKLYGPGAKGRQDGEYLDSIEGYVTADLNFRREHFRYSTVPLTFAGDSKRPALYKGLAVFEFTKWIADDAHGLGKLMFANGVPYRFSYLCPWLDVLGTETDWLRQGKYAPAGDTEMSLWRAMSGQKPFLFLMNTDYDRFTPDLVEKYFQRSLFYGMFPGMFSHNAADNPYWGNPKWYNRDRPLFKKYLPLIKRIAEAGWQAVTQAQCDNEKIYVERFGPDSRGATYVTVFNDTAALQKGILKIDKSLLQTGPPAAAKELISGKEFSGSSGGWEITLEPQQAGVIAIGL